MPTLRFFVAAFALFLASTSAQSLLLRPASTTPLEQLTGETFQIDSNGLYYYNFTASRTMSKYGLLGCDLGIPVVYSDKILLLYGDTLSTFTNANGQFVLTGDSGNDNISFIPNVDLSQCHYIPDVDAQLAQGNPNPQVSYGACPVLQTYENPNHAPADHIFQSTTISGLTSPEGTGADETPSGAFDYNGYLYMFYIVQAQIPPNPPHFALESILAKSDQPSASFAVTSPPTFHKLFQVSVHGAIADPSNPPPEAGSGGKFMFDAVEAVDNSTLAANGLLPGLPAALQSAPQVVFVFGSSWYYNHSNLYLAAFDIRDTESGVASWYYYAGRNGSNQWTSDEAAASPMLTSNPVVGNHSVLWNATLRRFVLMDGNIVASASATPWGPWSNPLLVFDPNGPWAQKLIHRTAASPIVREAPSVPVYAPNGTISNLNSSEIGVPYSPGQIDRPTANADGSTTIYFTMSTWNPYETYLMSSTFSIGPQNGPVVSGASFDASAVAAGSIASLFGPSLASGVVTAPTSSLPTSLGGRMVQVVDSVGKSAFADLYFVSTGQINFVMPAGAAPGSATVNVLNGSAIVYSAPAQIASVAPGVFTASSDGSGVASAFLVTIDSTGKQTTKPAFSCPSGPSSCIANPLDLSNAPGGAFIELYGTGIRANIGLAAVGAAIGGYPATVVYAGPQSQYEGMDQVNIQVPSQLQGAGDVTVTLLVDGLPTNAITVSFK